MAKMTDEDVEYCLNVVKESGAELAAWKIRAHIVAVMAERDSANRGIGEYATLRDAIADSLERHASEIYERPGLHNVGGGQPMSGRTVRWDEAVLRLIAYHGGTCAATRDTLARVTAERAAVVKILDRMDVPAEEDEREKGRTCGVVERVELLATWGQGGWKEALRHKERATSLEAEQEKWVRRDKEILERVLALEAEQDEVKSARDQLASANEERDLANSSAEAAEEAVRIANARAARMEQGRDALRERVQALEANADLLRRSYTNEEAREDITESRLAAIRQRAGDNEALEVVARAAWDKECDESEQVDIATSVVPSVARHILGDDAPASEMDGEEMAEPANPDATAREATSSEPTTAEAFATTWNALRDLTVAEPASSRAKSAYAALALLERRMGAMWPVLEFLAQRIDPKAHDTDAVGHVVLFSNDAWEARGYPRPTLTVGQARAALTDAPPVFTLEEVRAVFKARLHHRPLADAMKELDALRRKP